MSGEIKKKSTPRPTSSHSARRPRRRPGRRRVREDVIGEKLIGCFLSIPRVSFRHVLAAPSVSAVLHRRALRECAPHRLTCNWIDLPILNLPSQGYCDSLNHVCRNVCRSIAADSCQCGPLVRVSADKTTAPHGGRLNSNPAVPTE